MNLDIEQGKGQENFKSVSSTLNATHEKIPVKKEPRDSEHKDVLMGLNANIVTKLFLVEIF